jgi:exonuclease SbcD
MRILHTSDWHVGKSLRGESRLDEHRRVLAEIAAVAEDQRTDLVIVAGDVFDSAAPRAEAQLVAWEALLALRGPGRPVVVIAGNHDHADSFEAVRPVFAHLGITVAGRVARPQQGGVLEISCGDEHARIALLPWVARQHALRAEQLLDLEGSEAVQLYAARLQRMIETLCAGFGPDTINLLAGHAYLAGGVRGGGERVAQLIDEYFVTPHAFPATLGYIALGHLHKRQRIDAGVPLWYCGSPIQVDFGDDSEPRGVNLVEMSPGLPPRVISIALDSPARLATIAGPLHELAARAAAARADHFRVIVDDAPRPGLADDVRAVVPNAVEVTICARRDPAITAPAAIDHTQCAPRDLFGDYLDSEGHERDPALFALFDELLDEVGSA